MVNLIEAALIYKHWGFEVIPVLASKEPLFQWKQSPPDWMDDKHTIEIFSHPATRGLAIVCGSHSNGFEGLDMDEKYDLTRTLYARFNQKLQSDYPALAGKLIGATTRNNGHHFYYRCPEVGPSTALARRPSTIEELAVAPKWKVRVLIETRGEGAIIIVPPSPGYRYLQYDVREVQQIAVSEKKMLHDLATSFNLYQPSKYVPLFPQRQYSPEESPLLDYNNNADAVALLLQYGWSFVGTVGPRTYLRRPGTTCHRTSANYHHGRRLLSVFSTSTEFEQYKGYSPSAIYAMLACKNDFQRAAKELVAKGYGIPYKRQRA